MGPTAFGGRATCGLPSAVLTWARAGRSPPLTIARLEGGGIGEVDEDDADSARGACAAERVAEETETAPPLRLVGCCGGGSKSFARDDAMSSGSAGTFSFAVLSTRPVRRVTGISIARQAVNPNWLDLPNQAERAELSLVEGFFLRYRSFANRGTTGTCKSLRSPCQLCPLLVLNAFRQRLGWSNKYRVQFRREVGRGATEISRVRRLWNKLSTAHD